jgi:outer membrane protein TolC
MQTFQAEVYALGIKQAEKSYIVAKHRVHPKFSLFAGYNVRSETQATANFIDQVAVASRNYGVKMDWFIFDGWQTKGEKLQALANKLSYQKLQEIHVDAMTDAARTQHEQLGLSARQLAAAERGLDGARAVHKRAQDELAAGRAAQVDVDRARLNLLQAEARILPARIDYLNRWAEFVSLVGADPAMNHLPARYVR